eukprot:5282417-Pleurochrysis_carterae.AAC.1
MLRRGVEWGRSHPRPGVVTAARHCRFRSGPRPRHTACSEVQLAASAGVSASAAASTLAVVSQALAPPPIARVPCVVRAAWSPCGSECHPVYIISHGRGFESAVNIGQHAFKHVYK